MKTKKEQVMIIIIMTMMEKMLPIVRRQEQLDQNLQKTILMKVAMNKTQNKKISKMKNKTFMIKIIKATINTKLIKNLDLTMIY